MMPINPELDALLQKYEITKKYTDDAFKAMQLALEAIKEARLKKDLAFTKMEHRSNYHYTVWGQFYRFYGIMNSHIDTLQHEAKFANESRRVAIEAEVANLKAEINAARDEARRRTSAESKIAYRQAKTSLENATTHYETTKSRYERYKRICDEYEADLKLKLNQTRAAISHSTNRADYD